MISISCIFVAALMVSVATRVFDDLESAEKNPGQALRELKKECQMYLLQDDQDGLRMSLVMSNIRQAIEHNSKNFGWEMGLSCFSIMKQEERSKVILEKLPDHSNMTYRGRDRLQERDFISVTSAYTSTQPVTALCLNVPCQIDWRNVSGRSYVSAIKDQGSCGSCWAHAAAAALGRSNW